MPDIFAGPRIKLERANRHIGELVTEIERFRQRSPYEIVVNRNPATGQNALCAFVKELVPTHWGAIIGDAIHNIRTALDLMINDLVAPAFKGKGRFHIYATPNSRFAPNGIPDVKGLPAAHFKRMLALQPYNGGDQRLRDLHTLDIEDKHKIIVAAAIASAVKRFTATQRGTGGIMSAGEITIDTTKTGLQWLGISWADGMGLEPDNNFDVPIEVVFGDTDALPGAPVLPALYGFIEAVEKVLTDFSPPPPPYFMITNPVG